MVSPDAGRGRDGTVWRVILKRWLGVGLCLGCQTARGGAGVRRGPGAVIAPPSASQRAAVGFAERPEALCGGPNASGHLGDAVLENRFLRAVIEKLPGGAGFALSGGALIDLAPVDAGRVGSDELGQVFAMTGEFPRQIVHETMALHARPDGSAAVIVTGHDARVAQLRGETTYRLGGDDRFLSIETRLENTGDTAVTVWLGDAIQWGGAEHFGPGVGFDLPRRARFDWLGAVGVETAYALSAPEPLEGPHGGNWSDPIQAVTSLAPHSARTYLRRIAVRSGRRLEAARCDLGGCEDASRAGAVQLVDAAGRPVEAARVTLVDAAGRPLRVSASDARGEVEFHVEPGQYRVVVEAPGRAAQGPEATLTVPSRAPLRVTLSDALSLGVRVEIEGHPGAARVIFRRLDEGPAPSFGPIGRAAGARNSVVVDASGRVEVPLGAGRYEVTATRGPSYNLAAQRVEMAPGRAQTVTLALARVVDTRGYLCGDFHQHQAPSLDAPLTLRERVRADVAEGLEVAASTDHNAAVDLRDALVAEHLEGQLLTLAGVEVSTDIAARPWGHVNLFPVEVQPEALRGGVPDFIERPLARFFDEARSWAPGAVIQVNHPRAPGAIGMFEAVHLDPATGRADPEFQPHFDAIEVWNGRYQSAVEPVLRDWAALTRQGAAITLTGNSDSHAVVTQEAGWPRTCVAVAHDTVDTARPDEVVAALRQTRDVIIDGGFFIRVLTPTGASAIGQIVRTGTPLRVQVTSPEWLPPERLERLDAQIAATPVAMQFTLSEGVYRGETVVAAPRGLSLFRVRGRGAIATLYGAPEMTPMSLTNPVRGADAVPRAR